MSAREWLYARLTGALIDGERVSSELDDYRAEVLREAADLLHRHGYYLPEDLVRRMADTNPTQET